MNGFYSYIIECSDLTFYIGWTTNIEKRIKKHNSGKGAKYTRSRRPVQLKKFWTHENRSEAMKHEAALKKFSREQKQALINRQVEP